MVRPINVFFQNGNIVSGRVAVRLEIEENYVHLKNPI